MHKHSRRLGALTISAALLGVASAGAFAPAASAQTNVALNAAATATVAGLPALSCSQGSGPENAVDGAASNVYNDKWCVLAGSPTLRVALPAATYGWTVSKVVIKHAGVAGESAALNTRAYTLTGVAGTRRTTIASVTANTANLTVHDLDLANQKAMELTVVTPTQGLNTATRIYEVEVWAVRSAAPGGTISTIAGSGVSGGSGDGGAATSASMQNPLDVAVDASGHVLVSDAYNHRVRMVASASCAVTCPFGFALLTRDSMYTAAGTGAAGSFGDGALASTAALNYPNGVTVDRSGNLIIADQVNNRVRMVAGATCLSACPYRLAATLKGAIYTIAGSGAGGFAGDGGIGTSAQLRTPGRVTVDALGNVLISDTFNNRVRLLAGTSCSSACPFGLAAMTKGNIYTIAGTGIVGNAGDGGPATSAQMHHPNGLALDASGNLLIADTLNHRVRMVAGVSCASACPFGLVSTVKGRMYWIAGVGSAGFNGDGGVARAAQLRNPVDVAFDTSRNLLIADTVNNRVRMVPAATCASLCAYGTTSYWEGAIYTIAGTGATGFSGDGALASKATLSSPNGLAVDKAGNLLIADTNNRRVRLVLK